MRNNDSLNTIRTLGQDYDAEMLAKRKKKKKSPENILLVLTHMFKVKLIKNVLNSCDMKGTVTTIRPTNDQ